MTVKQKSKKSNNEMDFNTSPSIVLQYFRCSKIMKTKSNNETMPKKKKLAGKQVKIIDLLELKLWEKILFFFSNFKKLTQKEKRTATFLSSPLWTTTVFLSLFLSRVYKPTWYTETTFNSNQKQHRPCTQQTTESNNSSCKTAESRKKNYVLLFNV